MPQRTRRFRVLLATLLVSSVAAAVPAQAKPPVGLAVLRQQDRNAFVRFEALVDALDVAPGMTILDIGSGPGYASFLFAEKLRGSGAVFATDIRQDFVDRIAQEARRRGLDNLFPVAVKSEGLDDFYGRHRYDLVLLSNVYHCLENRVDYFRSLRAFLNRDARLVLVMYNQAPLFAPDDLPDVGRLVAALSTEPGNEPFRSRLSAGTRKLIEDKALGEGLKAALADDFNRMLVDPAFYKGFYDNSYFRKDLFTAAERDLANWLLMTLVEEGALEKPAGRLDARAMRAVVRLNRLFFAKRLGSGLAGGGAGAYVPAGDANRHTSKHAALRELDAAGYRFVKEIPLSPYFDAVVLTPAAP